MTRRTVDNLISQANVNLPDNNAGAITPEDVRGMIVDFLDTFTPMYGGLIQPTKQLALTGTAILLPFVTVIGSFPPEWMTDAVNGKLVRQLGSVPGFASRFTVGGVCEGPQGDEVNITLYKNGQPLSWGTELTLSGPAKSNGWSFTGIDGATTDSTYQIFVKTQQTSSSVNFKNVWFVGENIPIRAIPTAERVLG